MCHVLAHVRLYLCAGNSSKMKHQTISIRNDNRTEVLAQTPLIVSASRATDIPAFYADWFFNRLEKGNVRWRNPFSGLERGIGCYIRYALNDYEAEGLEPNIPPLTQRMETFRRIVDALGIGAVVWRFDPLIILTQSDSGLLDFLMSCIRVVIFLNKCGSCKEVNILIYINF